MGEIADVLLLQMTRLLHQEVSHNTLSDVNRVAVQSSGGPQGTDVETTGREVDMIKEDVRMENGKEMF